jgi:hypothetical protein
MLSRLFGLAAFACSCSAHGIRFSVPQSTEDSADDFTPRRSLWTALAPAAHPTTDEVKPAMERLYSERKSRDSNLVQASSSFRTCPPSTISIGRSPGAINSLSATIPKRS